MPGYCRSGAAFIGELAGAPKPETRAYPAGWLRGTLWASADPDLPRRSRQPIRHYGNNIITILTGESQSPLSFINIKLAHLEGKGLIYFANGKRSLEEASSISKKRPGRKISALQPALE